jgi:glucan phosphorylase
MSLSWNQSMGNYRLPQRIGRLDELANNLWWSWHDQARLLFNSLDTSLWESTGQNPVKPVELERV